MKEWRAYYKRIRDQYVHFVEHQGFAIILVACVLTIAGTALWTRQAQPKPATAPTPPVSDALNAAGLMQESLADIATSPSPAPTSAPVVFVSPLSPVQVLTDFDGARLQQSGVTGIWRLHDAIDLAADAGTQVNAMAHGTVESLQERGWLGAWVRIAHEGNIIATYAGMASIAGLAVGDPVSAGQVIGFIGNGVMDETNLPSHLHLHVTRNGVPINGVLLWK